MNDYYARCEECTALKEHLGVVVAQLQKAGEHRDEAMEGVVRLQVRTKDLEAVNARWQAAVKVFSELGPYDKMYDAAMDAMCTGDLEALEGALEIEP